MKKKLKYFATFYSPGSFFAEQWVSEIESPDPKTVEWPDRAYAFTISSRTDIHDGDEVFKGEMTQVGPMYYHPDSKVESAEELPSNPNASDTLIQNCKSNGWDAVIWTRWSNWPQPYEAGEHIVL